MSASLLGRFWGIVGMNASSDSFFESKYDLDPELHNLPSTVTFFPDMAQFYEEEETVPIEAPQLPSDWELKRIGEFQSKIEAIQNSKDSTYYNGRNAPLSKLSAHEIFGLANEVFGYNGWSSQLVGFDMISEDFEEKTDDIDNAEELVIEGKSPSGKYSAKYHATVKITLKDGFTSQDVGVGSSEGLPSKHQCYSKCKKEAVTDGMKKAIIGFRSVLYEYERVKREES